MPYFPTITGQELMSHAPDIAAIVLLIIAIIVSFAVSVYRRQKAIQKEFGNVRFTRQDEHDLKLQAEVPAVDMGAMLFPKVYTPTHKALSQENLLMKKV